MHEPGDIDDSTGEQLDALYVDALDELVDDEDDQDLDTDLIDEILGGDDAA